MGEWGGGILTQSRVAKGFVATLTVVFEEIFEGFEKEETPRERQLCGGKCRRGVGLEGRGVRG